MLRATSTWLVRVQPPESPSTLGRMLLFFYAFDLYTFVYFFNVFDFHTQ
jgi:hypothetical protein